MTTSLLPRFWIYTCIGSLLIPNLIIAVPRIDVVYPRPREGDNRTVIAKVDSNFIFGSVQPSHARLTINNTPVPVYLNGAFLAFLPVPDSSQTYHLHLETDQESADTSVSFLFPEQVPADTQSFPQFNCPTTIRFLPGNNVTRLSVEGAYDLFPIEGTTALALSQQQNFLQIKLTPFRSTWVETRFVEELHGAANPNNRMVHKIVCQSESGFTRVTIPGVKRAMYRLEDFLDPNEVRLTLFGVTSHLDLIKLNHDDPVLNRIVWQQPEDEVLYIHIYLKQRSWGYSAQWNNDALEITLNHPPDLDHDLEAITVAIDPGHGGDQFGAIGPTRLSEKELNLWVAQELYNQLLRAGARPVAVRWQDETLDLYERIDRARQTDADLLISIHHNAFADGVNPFSQTCGTGTYYYRPHSVDLARHIHTQLLKATGLPDDGLYYDNLALVRPTYFPAVLVEIGYLMIPEQEERFRSPSFRKRCAKALVNGIKSFLKARKKESS
jgi:N-acetylmuramoyl-L-alanine amidase